MGDFSVTCGISSISLYNDPTALILLKPSTSFKFVKFNGTKLYDGAEVLFTPLALPIFGKLDTYGQLENIQRDLNVTTLEETYETKIEQIIEWVEREDKERGKLPEDICGMYVHQEIYNLFCQPIKSEHGFFNSQKIENEIRKACQFLTKELDQNNYMEYITEKLDTFQQLDEQQFFNFKKLLKEKINDPEIVNGVINSYFVSINMTAANKMYMPQPLSGYQYGNDKLSTQLCRKAIKIMRERNKTI